MLLSGGDHTLEQKQLVGAQFQRRQNPSEAAVAGIEESFDSGIGVDNSELLGESCARGEPVAELGEARDFAAEVESGRRRDLQGLGGYSSDVAT